VTVSESHLKLHKAGTDAASTGSNLPCLFSGNVRG